MDKIRLILETIGTIAFAVSGASVGIDHKMDLFGVCALGMTTAVGGGIVRDIILGIVPPMAFEDPFYVLLSIAVSFLLFIIRKKLDLDKFGDSTAMLVCDTVGLAVFTIVGIASAFRISDNSFMAVFVGVVTGVGGGVMRDIAAQQMPYIFRKHVYATASLAGAILCVAMWQVNQLAASIAGSGAIVALRLLAAHFRWSLPKA